MFRSRSFWFPVLLAITPLSPAAEPADLVILHGKVLTVDAAQSQAEACAIRDGRFVAVGTNDQIRALVGDKTRVLDAGGKTVVPGLIESHVHATGASRGEITHPFMQLGSIREIQDWIRAEAGRIPAGQWIQTPRVDVTRIRERRIPTREELDAAAPQHPVAYVWQYANRQLQVLNSRAIQAAGITVDTPPPPKGKIHRDSRGELTGVLEDAAALTAKYLARPAVTEAQQLDSLERLLQQYNSLGITSIGERNSGASGVALYRQLQAAGRLPVRVSVTIGLGGDGSLAGTEQAIRALPFRFGDGDDWVRVGPLKVGVDGGILYGTALMREPYGPTAFSLYGIDDPQYRGDLRVPLDKLTNIIRAANRQGWQMSSHVTGDLGVDTVLDAIEAAQKLDPRPDHRYTLIHAYFPHANAAERAARLGVCVDTQPAWYFKDGDALAAALGGARLANFIGVRTWQAAGVKVALNSDHMQGFDPDKSLNPFNPFRAWQVAVERQTEGGQVFGPEQRISRPDALRMLTRDAAYLSYDENRKGSIEVGKLGDCAILTANPLECPSEELPQIRAVVTIVGGRVVWENGTP